MAVYIINESCRPAKKIFYQITPFRHAGIEVNISLTPEYTVYMAILFDRQKEALGLLSFFKSNNIEAVLYGSIGVSLYLGKFKAEFGDIDFLVPDEWIETKWQHLQELMQSKGFRLIDEHEHEFENEMGLQVAFAKISVLTRDGIVDSLNEVGYMQVGDHSVKTLNPEQFKRAYQFSVKDGYRLNVRGKKDGDVLRLLDDYISTHK